MDRYSFPVRLLHSRLRAGLSRRTQQPVKAQAGSGLLDDVEDLADCVAPLVFRIPPVPQLADLVWIEALAALVDVVEQRSRTLDEYALHRTAIIEDDDRRGRRAPIRSLVRVLDLLPRRRRDDPHR